MRLDWNSIDELIDCYSKMDNYDYDDIEEDSDEKEESLSSYGAEINMSYVSDADGYHLGVHMTDSEGLDISSEVEGDNLLSVLYAAMEEINTEMHKTTEQDERQKEIQQLRADIGNLQQRLDSLLNN